MDAKAGKFEGQRKDEGLRLGWLRVDPLLQRGSEMGPLDMFQVCYVPVRVVFVSLASCIQRTH